MKTYLFKVVVDPDEGAWSAHCPALADLGAATWGNTQEEALKHIHEVVEIIVQELAETPAALTLGGHPHSCLSATTASIHDAVARGNSLPRNVTV